MRANISHGDATNVNLCRQLQMQTTRLHPAIPANHRVYVSAMEEHIKWRSSPTMHNNDTI